MSGEKPKPNLDDRSLGSDGKPEGLCKKYHLNGQLKFEGNWKDDKQEGLWKFYYENGQLESEGNYKEGELRQL